MVLYLHFVSYILQISLSEIIKAEKIFRLELYATSRSKKTPVNKKLIANESLDLITIVLTIINNIQEDFLIVL